MPQKPLPASNSEESVLEKEKKKKKTCIPIELMNQTRFPPRLYSTVFTYYYMYMYFVLLPVVVKKDGSRIGQ